MASKGCSDIRRLIERPATALGIVDAHARTRRVATGGRIGSGAVFHGKMVETA
jgi:hypothetical protein